MTTPQTEQAATKRGLFRPVAGAERIESLDVLRGFALLGILVVNSLLFALPMLPAMEPPWSGAGAAASTTPNWVAWWIVSVFFQWKFISLFSILFGAGAAIQFDRARAAGRAFDWFFIRRLIILLIFGVLHALLFWYGDILTLYALIGVWLLLFCRLRPATLVIIGTLLLLFAAVVSGGLGALAAFIPENPGLKASVEELPEGWLAPMQAANFDPNATIWQLAEERAYREGPYGDLFAFRMVSWLMGMLSGLFTYGWHILAMFAFGVAIVRSGFFGAGGSKLRVWAITLALPIGLVLEALCALIMMLWAPEHRWLIGVVSAVHEGGVFLTAIGYAAVVVAIVRSGILSLVAAAVACVGRMALTNYLLETVIMTSIFYYYGLGYFAQVDRIWLLVMSILIWIGLVIFSTLWLSVFTRGPLEWIWRLLSYGRRPGRG